MTRIRVVAITCALAVATGGYALAQSAKHTLQVSSLTLVEATSSPTEGWVTIFGDENPSSGTAVTIRTSQQKDLLFSVALECGLFTRTLARSKGGAKDTSSATATVDVRVVVDPGTAVERIAEPGDVTFCERTQTLSATLQGIIGNLACFPDGVFDPEAPGCDLTPEEIELILDTLEANAFFFALDDMGAGVHNVIVQVQIDFDSSVQEGEAEAAAFVGKGALVVEEIRLVKDLDISLE